VRRGGGLTGGILAAGEGSRLRADGWPMPKPLVPVAGVPLLERVIGNFRAAEIEPVTIIVNERGRDCVQWSRTRFPAVDLRFIVKTTGSSLESFAEVAADDTPGAMLISTVDAWCHPADFVRFVAAATARPPAATVLAVTPLVADENPVWVTLDDDGRVRRLGERAGDVVTAGLYLIPEALRRQPPPRGLERLRDFLGWLVERGDAVYAETIQTVVDVDRACDVTLAESLGQASRSG
jgi:NDP-sugar pyrophosphorylase family protein